MTAQTFLDNLRYAVLSMDQVALIVFDECHHAKKAHPYNRIMTEFYSTAIKKPKILGLTASPVSTGVSKSDSSAKQSQLLQNLSQNLNDRSCECQFDICALLHRSPALHHRAQLRLPLLSRGHRCPLPRHQSLSFEASSEPIPELSITAQRSRTNTTRDYFHTILSKL
jgi:hypothetical protein